MEAYREIGDGIAAARATARLGRVLLETGEIQRATQLLEAALPGAEAMDDQSAMAEILANLARAYMRAGEAGRSVDAADRALTVAERLNLETVVTEGLINKGSALTMLGRRRESVALHFAALELAQGQSDRSVEMRARNNLASALSEDEPARATRMLLEGMAVARQVGDRGMYYWLAGTAGPGLIAEGRGWDAHIPLLEEALETAGLRYDRERLRILLGLFQLSRGEKFNEVVEDVRNLVGDSTDPEDLFTLYMAEGHSALLSGDLDTAFEATMKAVDLKSQNPEIPMVVASRSAIWARNVDRVRRVDRLIASLPTTGAQTQVYRAQSAAALAALEGRTGEAVAGFRDVDSRMREMEQFFDAAACAIDAAVLLPDDPEIRARVEKSRPLLVELRAKPYLQRLDIALAGASPVAPAADKSRAAASPLTPAGS